MEYTQREQVVEVLNRLFYYTDYQLWDLLVEEVFAGEVLMDMTSLGAQEARTMTGRQICEEWRVGFKGLDAVHHQAGNYMVEIDGASARVKAYAIAIHYRKDARDGSTREFTGSYDFALEKKEKGWRLTAFKFNLKFVRGNLNLE